MTVAVTGATGFVGRHLVDALVRRGDDVVALVRSPKKTRELEAAGVRLVFGDLDQDRALELLVRDARLVYHVAGLVAARDEAEFLRVNRDGTERLARAAHAAGVPRFLLVSSLAVTGPTDPGWPKDESGEPDPVTPYGRSKRAAEDAVKAAGIPFTIVRPPIVYGPRDRQVLRLFLFAKRRIAPLVGDGSQELSLVHAADLAEALIAAATSPATVGGTYHAAHPEHLTQRQLLETVGRVVGATPVLVPVPRVLVLGALHAAGLVQRLARRASLVGPDKAPEILAPAWTCSSAALVRDTPWRATLDAEEGLRQTADWYRAEGWL